MIEELRLEREGKGWMVCLRLETGVERRYRYRTEAQARYFAAVFALGPRILPPVPTRPRRPRASRARTGVTPSTAVHEGL